jgi:hypothetical protein
VCTTGISKDKIGMIRDYADLAWSCASFDVRRIIGPLARYQLSLQIPVFVLTKKGTDFVSAYANDEEIIRKLDETKQYLFSNDPGGKAVYLGDFKAFTSEARLPVKANKEPSFADENKCVPA